MSSHDLLTLFEGLGHPRVLVLGDLILDRYTWGNAERVSQEAPVILLRSDKREIRLGGAANVCQMVRGLEAEVTCAGVVGKDDDGLRLRELMAEYGIDTSCLLTDPSRPTTVKERFIGRAQGRHPHQILRVDSEVRDPLLPSMEGQLRAKLLDRIRDFDVVLISDYDKGVCTPTLLRAVIDAANRAAVPVLVDPIRSNDYSRYQGATTMTPNRTEAEMATGMKILQPADALRAGEELCRRLNLQMGIVTLDRDGMALILPDSSAPSGWRGEVFPTRPRAVYDITGAGDMVLSMIGVALACSVRPQDAVRLGNIAGGLEVEKVGVAVIPREEIRQWLLTENAASADLTAGKLLEIDRLEDIVSARRQQGEKVVFTNGCFDLLHVGHLRCLREARSFGDLLIVGINSDLSVRRLKGAGRPVISQTDRAALLAALSCVDYVAIFDEDTPLELIGRLRPDVLVKGGGYQTDQVVGRELVEAHGGEVRVTGQVEGISTTALLHSLLGDTSVRGPHFPVRASAENINANEDVSAVVPPRQKSA